MKQKKYNTNSRDTMVRIKTHTRELLRDISEETGISMTRLLHDIIVKEYERVIEKK